MKGVKYELQTTNCAGHYLKHFSINAHLYFDGLLNATIH